VESGRRKKEEEKRTKKRKLAVVWFRVGVKVKCRVRVRPRVGVRVRAEGRRLTHGLTPQLQKTSRGQGKAEKHFLTLRLGLRSRPGGLGKRKGEQVETSWREQDQNGRKAWVPERRKGQNCCKEVKRVKKTPVVQKGQKGRQLLSKVKKEK
jgi:hypothetical protein